MHNEDGKSEILRKGAHFQDSLGFLQFDTRSLEPYTHVYNKL